MITKIFGKKHAQLVIKILSALAVVYLFLLVLHSLNCSKSPSIDKFDEDDDSIPARIKIGSPDIGGRVQFFASFDSKDLLRIWNKRNKKLPPSTPPSNKVPSVHYNLVNTGLCKNKNVEWIAYILSSPEEASKRKLLRETWANTKLIKSDFLQTIFVMGTTADQAVQEKLLVEHSQFHDIVQGDFLDSSKTKSLKAILGMRWVSDFCNHSKFALKANDASFINIFGLMALLDDSDITDRSIVCSLWGENQMPILRDPVKCGAWCVREDEFPGRNLFPEYCAGVGYLLKVPLLQEIYTASLNSTFFWIEDVFVTGVLAKTLDKPVDFVNINSKFSLDHDFIKSQYLEEEVPIETFLSDVNDEKLFRQLWQALIHKLPLRWSGLLSNSTTPKMAR